MKDTDKFSSELGSVMVVNTPSSDEDYLRTSSRWWKIKDRMAIIEDWSGWFRDMEKLLFFSDALLHVGEFDMAETLLDFGIEHLRKGRGPELPRI